RLLRPIWPGARREEGASPGQWGCDRRATKPQAKFGASLRAAVLFGPGGVARSLQIHGRDMRVARALPGPKTPRRKRHRIYALDHLAAPKGVQLPPARSSGIGSFELVWSLELGAWSFFSITHFP